ncbi:MAG: D-glycero-beta-D-manno-heptose-7-phosphate kinase [Alphaproteobacteria bacterium]|nr:MAG: D-glycero-beta-D-manno-heptose-7-phosphate kinase [Alphaproteobacteria bacterium]
MIENSVLFEDLNRLSGSTVLCVGDVMLDRFVYGGVERISPEAPIPVLLVEREKHMLGGAGNVVANIAALGGKAVLLAVVGNDAAGADVARLLSEMGVEAGLEIAADRHTIVKSRFVSGGQQILRVDREKTAAIPADIEQKLIARAEKLIPDVGAIILSDYKKGLLTDTLVSRIIDIARRHGKPVVVDPKGQDFARYRGATVITPNRKELETATAMKAGTDEEVRAAAMKIITGCGISTVLATRSKDGMSLISESDAPAHIPANVREVYDVSGAGDTVIAAFASALAAGVTMRNAALLSNIAAGIVVGKPGTATARPEEIEKVLSSGFAMEKQSYQRKTKLTTKQGAAEQADRWRTRGFRVGFTNGCFDLLHPGHLSTLRQAKAACDYLVVAINSDASVKRLKGPTRPVQDETARTAILSALEMVDLVVVFDEDTPIEYLKAVKPDVLIKGGQYKLEEVVGYDLIASWGGKVVRAEMEEGFSTTNTIQKMAG